MAKYTQVVKGGSGDLSNYYTKRQVDAKLGNYYKKTEVDEKLADYYDKTTIDEKLGDYYNKAEADSKYVNNNLFISLSNYIVAILPINTGFEYGEEYSATNCYRTQVGGSYNVNEAGDAAWDQWNSNIKHSGEKGLRLKVNRDQTAVLKVKMNEFQQLTLARNGVITLFATALRGKNDGASITINGNEVLSGYFSAPEWQPLNLGNLAVDADGYISINIYTDFSATHIFIDDINVVPDIV